MAVLTNTALTLNEDSAPSTPSSGRVIIYAKTDGNVYQKDDAGVETSLKNPAVKTLYLAKSISIENPTNAEDIPLFFTSEAITITEIRAVLRGSDTPSVTWTIRHGSDISGAGTEVKTGGTATTSVSTGSDVTSFDDATIPADSFVWIKTTAQSGTVTQLSVTIIYTID